MVRPAFFLALLAATACSDAHWQGGGRAGGGGGGGGAGASDVDSEGWSLEDTAPDPAHDDDEEDLPADGDDTANAPDPMTSLSQPYATPLDYAFDELVGTSSSALTADCPDNRNLERFDGPASWPQKYGVKGVCVDSHYDCRMPASDPDFRRYENPKDPVDGAWPVALGIPVLDGRGNPIGKTTVTAAKLDFGQRKWLAGKQHVYAFSVGSGADDVSGWVPASCIGWDGTTAPAATCVSKSGTTPSDFPVVNGRKPAPGHGAVEKYTIVTPDWFAKHYPMLAKVNLDDLKITCNAPDAPHRSLADYLPQLSADQTFYKVNLLANLPGISPALGGIAADTFRVARVSGTNLISDKITFHRLVHVRSIVVYLFKPLSSAGAPYDGAHVRFVYGYVLYPKGSGWLRRYGWLPYFALAPQ